MGKNDHTIADRQARFRDRQKDAGKVEWRVWVTPSERKTLEMVLADLRGQGPD